HGIEQRQEPIADDQPPGRDVGVHADEEEREHAGEECRLARALQRLCPVERLDIQGLRAGLPSFGERLRADWRRLCRRGCNVVRGHQTFSTSGLPSSPEGRKISTIARIEKAATSLYSTVK